MKFDLIRPCVDCPFRSDKRFHLSKERAREFAESEGQFACHKTVDYSRGPEGRNTDKTQACAGSILMQEHEGRPNQMLRIAERLGIYDARKMDMGAPVYRSRREFIRANSDRRAPIAVPSPASAHQQQRSATDPIRGER